MLVKETLNEMEIEAIQLCAGFSRCMNYPRDEDGVIALARGLVRAQRLTHVLMDRIVAECLETSMYCPTDSDFISMARDIRGPEKAEDIPIPSQEEVRKQWQSLAHRFPRITENGRIWHEEYRTICGRIKARMGAEEWIKASSREKVRVGIEMGLQVHIQPPDEHTVEDMGIGIFVPRFNL